jgi:Flp pilus assembly protein TadG
MRSFLRKKLAGLVGCSSGNATLLVAMGMPMLIGGAGLGVDLTQWYMWKRELQHAVDQAAIAGAWARSVAATENTYATRATQEFNANLSTIKGTTTAPVVGLALYGGGVNVGGVVKQNSVTVHATASRSLPFTGFFTSEAPQIYAYAQAAFQDGSNVTSCLVALEKVAASTIIVGGNTVLTAGCGMMALSNAEGAVTANGNPTVKIGDIYAAGADGVDPFFDTTGNTVHEGYTGGVDPFDGLTPPTNSTPGSYNCVKGKTTSTATQTTGVDTQYTYWKGADPINYPGLMQPLNVNNRTPNTNTKKESFVLVDGVPTNGVTTVTTWTKLNGNGSNANWEKKVVTTDDSYTGVVTTTSPDTGIATPGTYYGGIKIQCDTVFSKGVYVLDGGGLDISGNYNVTGASVMFVLKNGAYIDIRGTGNINLTAIQAADLIAAGVSASDANKLAGMLVFESSGSTSSKNLINGNATTVLNGAIYLPNSNMDFSGTASVTSQCLLIASLTIRFIGDVNMTSFCPANVSETHVSGKTKSTVKLVA